MKQRILNFLFKRLLNAVVINDVITSDKGILKIGGTTVQETELKSLIAEAKALEGFRLWTILNESIKKDALDRGWNKSTNLDDLNAGKTMYYTLDLQNSIITLIRNKEKK